MTDTLASLVDPAILAAVGSAIGAAGIGLWLAAAWWTYADMGRRTSSEIGRFTAAGWIILSTPLLLPLSLPVYLLARPQATLAQRRSRDMVEALAPSLLAPARCEACGSEVDELWQRCPACATWLQAACPDCGRWSARDLEICPWCASARGWLADEPALPDESALPDEPATRLLDPAPLLPEPLVPTAAFSEPVPLQTRRTPGPRELRRGAPGRGSEVVVGGAPATLGR